MSGATMQAAAGGTWVDLDATYQAIDLDLASATASIRFDPDGDIVNHNSISLGQWIQPEIGATDGTGYQIRATANPDTPDTGSMNIWSNLSGGGNQWTESRSGSVGDDTKVFDIEIRSSSSGTILASTTVTLKAEIII